jgi:ElaB/YqjD/DUF883 family membrane-anchored ribosome-binding protein
MRQWTLVATDPSGDLPYDATNPMANQEKFMHDMRRNLYGMAGQSFEVLAAVESDVTSFHDSFVTFVNTFDTWIDSAVVASAQGSPIPDNPAIPSILASIPALLAGGWQALIPILVNFMIDLAVRHIEGKLNPDGASQDMQAIVDKLEETLKYNGLAIANYANQTQQRIENLSDQLEEIITNSSGEPLGDVLEKVESAVKTILTEHSINLYSDKEDITFRSGFLVNP